jgi:hypothetical protein
MSNVMDIANNNWAKFDNMENKDDLTKDEYKDMMVTYEDWLREDLTGLFNKKSFALDEMIPSNILVLDQ